MNRLWPTRLPERPVKAALVSGEYPQLSDRLNRLGIQAVPTCKDLRLPDPIAWHPDTQTCVLGGRVIVLQGSPLTKLLKEWELTWEETLQEPGDSYPRDALCNVLVWDRFALGNPRTADAAIISAAEDMGLSWIPVKQGYPACSVALVNESAAITADQGIAAQLERYSMTVLHISPGYIRLPGYDTGFIGGCCGKLAADKLAFAGCLDRHPDGQRIRDFLKTHGVSAVELFDGELVDVGGIVPLC